MASWSRQRRFSYAAVVFAVIILAVGSSLYFAFRKVPSCFDGLQNGDELGVDCGGSCTRLCQSAFIPPSVAWTRFKQVAPGFYNAAAYIVNLNPKAEALAVPYHIELLDANGAQIVDARGTVDIPSGRNTLAFQGTVKTGTTTPIKAFFEFTGSPVWGVKSDPLSSVTITNKDYQEGPNGSSLSVTLANGSAAPLDHVLVYVILEDKDGNALDFSKTIVDEIPGQGTAMAPFTWQTNHSGEVVSIEVLPVAE